MRVAPVCEALPRRIHAMCGAAGGHSIGVVLREVNSYAMCVGKNRILMSVHVGFGWLV